MFVDLLVESIASAITPAVFVVLGVWMLRTGRRSLGWSADWDLRCASPIVFVSIVALAMLVGHVVVGIAIWIAIISFATGVTLRVAALFKHPSPPQHQAE